MKFEDWMLYRGLSISSVKKYDSAIRGALSDWAIKNGIMSFPLTSLVSTTQFKLIASQIRKLSVYQERNERGHGMYNAALTKFSEYLSEDHGVDVEKDIDDILSNVETSITEKSSLIKARVGQGGFRQKLVLQWKGCSVTGIKETGLLVASHIKPWSVSNNKERLDPFNGLLLTPNLDKVFDLGLISFEQNGKILISPLLIETEKLGISANLELVMTDRHEPYMKFHRTEVFRQTC